ncbi:MAG: uracil-DNA glycosylase family 4 [Alphaproteobacteria bacterium]|jgi:uracil-DNA glycosylase family 4
MSDLLKSSDLGITYHISDHNTFNKSSSSLYTNSSDDIWHKISSLSSNLSERDFELAQCRPLLPSHFKIKPLLANIKNTTNISPNNLSPTRQLPYQKYRSLASTTQHDAEKEHNESLLSHISQAETLALKASDLPSLHESINTFNSHLDCQKFAYNTLAYQDISNVDILWISESVTPDDDRMNQVFSDNTGKMIEKLFKNIGFGRSEKLNHGQIGFLNASFWPLTSESNSDKNHDAYQICLPFVKKIITLVKPQKIIISGDAPLYHLLNIDSSLQAQGKPLILSLDSQNFQCYSVFSMDYILKSDIAKKNFWFDLLRILQDNT